jgi:aminoglycoside phosphotransferase (APT) family kinase protein
VGGWTRAERWVIHLRNGASLFVKAATDENEEGERPFLLLEDLSECAWPPPWTSQRIDAVLAALEAVRAASPPPSARSAEELHATLASWRQVAADPQPFLGLGLCTPEWLHGVLPDLIAAEDAARREGSELLHMDVRSDNVCFDGERANLVDWNHASVGEGAVDIAGWLPSLRAEGGPPPESLLPGRGDLAALFCGYWAARAGLPPPQPGSRVREVQLRQLHEALPWAIRELGLQ